MMRCVMKRFILFPILVFSFFAIANTGEGAILISAIEQVDGDINQKDAQGRKQGQWVVYGKDAPNKGYPADGKIEEGPYKDDRKNGTWTSYHKDGATPRLIGVYEDGRPKGTYKKFHENGEVKEEGAFVNGKQQGTFKTYYEDGTVAQEKTFNAEGKEDGVQKYYHPNGQVEFEFTKKNGVNSGTATRYTSDGQVKQVTTYGANGEVVSVDNKDVKEEKVVETGGGGPSGNGGDTKGKPFEKDGYNKVYNKNEDLWMDGKFQSGKLWDGKLYKYDSDGILLKIEIWKNGKYHSDGQL